MASVLFSYSMWILNKVAIAFGGSLLKRIYAVDFPSFADFSYQPLPKGIEITQMKNPIASNNNTEKRHKSRGRKSKRKPKVNIIATSVVKNMNVLSVSKKKRKKSSKIQDASHKFSRQWKTRKQENRQKIPGKRNESLFSQRCDEIYGSVHILPSLFTSFE